jgi:hypothetical protein
MNPFRIAWLKHCFYALVALALMLCLAEIGLRVYDSATGQITRRELYDRGLTCKSWFAHHTLRPSQAFLVKHPDGDGKTRIVVNSLGLRGPEPAIPKPAGTFRIVWLGDDRVFGRHVDDERTSVRLLGDKLRGQTGYPVETINAGVPDYCPLLSFLQLRHQLLSLQPDLILLQWDMTDVADDRVCRKHLVTSTDRTPLACGHPDLLFRRHDTLVGGIPCLLPVVLKRGAAGVFVEAVMDDETRAIDSRRARYAWLEDHPPDWSPYIAQALEPVAATARMAEALSIPCVLVVVPAPWQVSPDACPDEACRSREGVAANAHYTSGKPLDTITEFCERKNIRSLDLTELMRRAENSQDLYLRASPDLSEQGHELIARAVAHAIRPLLPGGRPSGVDTPSDQPPPPDMASNAGESPLREARLPRPPPLE